MTTTPQSDETLDNLLTMHLHEIKAGHDGKLKLALTAYIDAEVTRRGLEEYKRGLLYNKQVHKDFSELGADVSIQAEIRRANAELKKARGLPNLSTEEESE